MWMVSMYSKVGVGVVHYAAAGLDVGNSVLEDGGSDGYGGVHVSGEVEVADGAGVGCAAVGF